jgi:cell division protein DivIC
MAKKSNKRKSTDISAKRFKQFIILTLILGYISFITFGSHGLITLSELNHESNSNIRLIKQLKDENVSLKSNLKLTKSDSKKIEQIAREKYNMHKKGETVFIIEKK